MAYERIRSAIASSALRAIKVGRECREESPAAERDSWLLSPSFVSSVSLVLSAFPLLGYSLRLHSTCLYARSLS